MIPINPEAIGDPNQTPIVYVSDAAAEVLGIPRRAKWFGPCRAGLHPEFGWGEPCLSDAAWYVEVQAAQYVHLCGDHAADAEKLDGYKDRRPLHQPYEAPVVTL